MKVIRNFTARMEEIFGRFYLLICTGCQQSIRQVVVFATNNQA